MATENIEKAFNEIGDDPVGDSKIEWLKGLLKSVQVNRHALGIIRAMKTGDKKRVSEIVAEAKGGGISVDELNIACRILRK